MSDLFLAQLHDRKPVRLEKNGRAICVARVGEEVFAFADTCTHAEASLAEGDISNFKIECWLHGAEFDLRSGEALSLPATEAVQTYAVRIDGDSVTIEI
jgi:3-phenylpropionate/trans-cinnamate dioxygenase ferredoxin subunit